MCTYYNPKYLNTLERYLQLLRLNPTNRLAIRTVVACLARGGDLIDVEGLLYFLQHALNPVVAPRVWDQGMNPCLLRLARINYVRSNIIDLSLRLAIKCTSNSTRASIVCTLAVFKLNGYPGGRLRPSLLSK